MAEDNKTEKATEHRRKKAREEGQVARSRELSATAAMLAGVLVLVAQGPARPLLWRQFFRAVLDHAVRNRTLYRHATRSPGPRQLLFQWTWKPLAAAWGVAALVSRRAGRNRLCPQVSRARRRQAQPGQKTRPDLQHHHAGAGSSKLWFPALPSSSSPSIFSAASGLASASGCGPRRARSRRPSSSTSSLRSSGNPRWYCWPGPSSTTSPCARNSKAACA